MDRETFKELCAQAGFKKKHELARFLGLNYQSVNNWGSGACEYPNYLRPLLEALIKARKYDEAVREGKIL